MEECGIEDKFFCDIKFKPLEQGDDDQNPRLKTIIELRYTSKFINGIRWNDGTKTIVNQREENRRNTCETELKLLFAEEDHTLVLVSPVAYGLGVPGKWLMQLAYKISIAALNFFLNLNKNVWPRGILSAPSGVVSAIVPLIVEIAREQSEWRCEELAIKRVMKLVSPMRNDIDNKGNCVVCLEGFSKENYALRLPCSHLFHQNCIASWLLENSSCPICRFEMPI